MYFLYFLALLVKSLILTLVVIKAPLKPQSQRTVPSPRPRPSPTLQPKIMKSFSSYSISGGGPHYSVTTNNAVHDSEEEDYDYDYDDTPRPPRRRPPTSTPTPYNEFNVKTVNFNTYRDLQLASELESKCAKITSELKILEKMINSFGFAAVKSSQQRERVIYFETLMETRKEVLNQLDKLRPPLPPIKFMFKTGSMELRKDITDRLNGPFSISKKQCIC